MSGKKWCIFSFIVDKNIGHEQKKFLKKKNDDFKKIMALILKIETIFQN